MARRYKMSNGRVVGIVGPVVARVWGMGLGYYVGVLQVLQSGGSKPEPPCLPKLLRLKDCKHLTKAGPNPPAFMIPQKPVRL